MTDRSQLLRKAIENLIDAKLLDLTAKPGGLDRLLAHRRSGVASFDIRNAERKLDEALSEILGLLEQDQHHPEGQVNHIAAS